MVSTLGTGKSVEKQRRRSLTSEGLQSSRRDRQLYYIIIKVIMEGGIRDAQQTERRGSAHSRWAVFVERTNE